MAIQKPQEPLSKDKEDSARGGDNAWRSPGSRHSCKGFRVTRSHKYKNPDKLGSIMAPSPQRAAEGRGQGLAQVTEEAVRSGSEPSS